MLKIGEKIPNNKNLPRSILKELRSAKSYCGWTFL